MGYNHQIERCYQKGKHNFKASHDVIILRSRDLIKTLRLTFSIDSGYKIWTLGLPKDTNKVKINLNETDDVMKLRSHGFKKML